MNTATEHSHTVAPELLAFRSCMSYLKTAIHVRIYDMFFVVEAADLGIDETSRQYSPGSTMQARHPTSPEFVFMAFPPFLRFSYANSPYLLSLPEYLLLFNQI